MRVRVSVNDTGTEGSGSRDVFSLGSATQLLQQIRSEHLYSTPSNCSLDKYCGTDEQPSTSKEVPENDITSILDKLKARTATKYDRSDVEFDMLTLNAASIQRQFESMIDMTAFAHIPESVLKIEENTPSTSRVKKVNFVNDLPESDIPEKDNATTSNPDTIKAKAEKTKETKLDKSKTNEENANKTPNEKEKKERSSKTSDRSKIKRSKARRITSDSEPDKNNVEKTTYKSVNSDDWRSINKALEEERTLNLYLKHAAELLVRRWGEYLAMTSEQIRQFEIQNAKEVGMIDEVIEMLEDKDRYVWQLIDELRFW